MNDVTHWFHVRNAFKLHAKAILPMSMVSFSRGFGDIIYSFMLARCGADYAAALQLILTIKNYAFIMTSAATFGVFPEIERAMAKHEYAKVGDIVRNGYAVALLMAPIAAMLLFVTPIIVIKFSGRTPTNVIAFRFLIFLLPAIFTELQQFSNQQICYAKNKPHYALAINSIGSLVQFVLSVVIFINRQKIIAPEILLSLAYVARSYINFIGYGILFKYNRHFIGFGIFTDRCLLSKDQIISLLKTGLPLSFFLLSEFASGFLTSFYTLKLGKNAMAINGICGELKSYLMLPALGIITSTIKQMAYHIGNKDQDRSRTAGNCALYMSLFYGGLVFLAIQLYPAIVLDIFLGKSNPLYYELSTTVIKLSFLQFFINSIRLSFEGMLRAEHRNLPLALYSIFGISIVSTALCWQFHANVEQLNLDIALGLFVALLGTLYDWHRVSVKNSSAIIYNVAKLFFVKRISTLHKRMTLKEKGRGHSVNKPFR